MRRGRVPPGCRAHRRSHGSKMNVNLSFHLSRRDMEYTIGKALSTMSRARYELCQQPQQRSDDFGAATGEEGHQKTKTGDNMEVNPELIVGRKTVSCSDDRRCSIRDAGVPPVEQDPTIGMMIHKSLCNLGCRWRRINSSHRRARPDPLSDRPPLRATDSIDDSERSEKKEQGNKV
jgi:hypothetical protein